MERAKCTVQKVYGERVLTAGMLDRVPPLHTLALSGIETPWAQV